MLDQLSRAKFNKNSNSLNEAQNLHHRKRETAFSSVSHLIVAVILIAVSAVVSAQSLDPALLSGLSARSIGPAGMSGRVAAIESIPENRNIIYVGAATGGLWKSVNAGLSWTPIFDDQPVAAIGAVQVFPANPDIVWVGTGEGNPRNSASVGRGVFRSIDAGSTWQQMGLEKTERIHRVIPHPTDQDTVYVAAMGQAWGENPERGIYKTTDGGQSWQKVLYVDEKTGAADLIMDPTNPNKLFAAMWEYRRWPWSFKSGGPGSGLYVTYDGGENWKKLTPKDGLPHGELGRIGLGISESNPNIVYALIEAEKSALIRSTDGGSSWQTRNQEPNVASRPFYYADLRVDPQQPNRIYRLESITQVSEDGGKTFSPLIPWEALHPDHHAMWIDPNDGRYIIDGNDGGIGISHDHGKTWRFASNLPLAQFYHIAVDNDVPYNVYGGLQDNGSWRGPAEVWETDNIRNHHWDEVSFGDGFDTQPDPENSRRGYGMSQDGFLVRWDLDTGERKMIRPATQEGQASLRFNWNAGFAQDPFDPARIYYGSQFVHRSDDRGNNWTTISPDLTTDRSEWQQQAESGGLTPDVTAAENFTSITSIAPSPLEAGVIWAGTDDGRVHVTRDGGDNWTSLEQKARGVPENTWVPMIFPSPHEAGTAFIVFDNHRRSDWTTYVFRVEQYGQRWKRLNGDDVDGYALSIVQDLKDPGVLYLGTEFGLFVSLDSGSEWMKWTHGLPTVAVKDLALQERDDDLIIGTHGRAAYVIDDLSALRALKSLDTNQKLTLLPHGPAQQYQVKQTAESRFPGAGEFYGKNEPYGATFSIYLNDDRLPHPDQNVERSRPVKLDDDNKAVEAPKLYVQVSTAEGEEIRKLEFKPKQGLNRFTWDLNRDGYPVPAQQRQENPNPASFEVMPGKYQVEVSFDKETAKGTVTVMADPRYQLDRAGLQARKQALKQTGAVQAATTRAIDQIDLARQDIQRLQKLAELKLKDVEQDAKEQHPLTQFTEKTQAATKSLTELEKKLWNPPSTKGIVADTAVWQKLNIAWWFLQSSWDQPTPSHLGYLAQAEQTLDGVLTEVNNLFAGDIQDIRTEAKSLALSLLSETGPIEVTQP